MEKSLWLPLSIALACTVTTTVLAGVMPETLPHGRDNRPLDPDYVRKPGHVERGLRGHLSVVWRHTSSTLGFIISHSSILYLVVTFLVVDYSRQSLGILLQYISLRYSVPISRISRVACNRHVGPTLINYRPTLSFLSRLLRSWPLLPWSCRQSTPLSSSISESLPRAKTCGSRD